MRIHLLLVTVASCALALSAGEARDPVTFTSPCSCEGNHGVERWADKTDLSEPPTNSADIRSVTPAAIAGWGGAGGDAARDRRQGLETSFFAVTGRVTKVKLEDDGDLHLSLEDVSQPGRVVVEIPLGDRWCALRKTVFSWSGAQLPLPAGKSLKLTRQPIVTVVGKAFYDAGHASAAKGRTYDPDLAVWEIHPVMEMTESAGGVAANASPAYASIPRPPAASTPAPPAATTEAEEFVVLTQAVRIRIPYGETTLPPGTKLPVVSRTDSAVNIRYLDQIYPIPAASTGGQ